MGFEKAHPRRIGEEVNNREIIESISLVGGNNLDTILYLLRQTAHLPGINAEVGVYRGGTALLIASNSTKTFFAFDTFEGLPEPTVAEGTIHKKGEFACDFVSVMNLLLRYENAQPVKGVFPQDSSRVVEKEKFSFVYLDVDLYKSTLDCLEFFYPRMVPGGVLATDDYGWKKTPGVKMACDEFLSDKPEKIRGGHIAYIVKE